MRTVIKWIRSAFRRYPLTTLIMLYFVVVVISHILAFAAPDNPYNQSLLNLYLGFGVIIMAIPLDPLFSFLNDQLPGEFVSHDLWVPIPTPAGFVILVIIYGLIFMGVDSGIRKIWHTIGNGMSKPTPTPKT